MNGNNFSYILERLSSRAKNALIAAQLVSEELKHDHIGTEHLLYGVVSEKSSFAAEILTKTKLTPEVVKQELIFVNSNNTKWHSEQWIETKYGRISNAISFTKLWIVCC